jgi:hypothetical protein
MRQERPAKNREAKMIFGPARAKSSLYSRVSAQIFHDHRANLEEIPGIKGRGRPTFSKLAMSLGAI